MSGSNPSIRPATAADCATLFKLSAELAELQQVTSLEPRIDVAAFQEDFCPSARFFSFVADLDGDIVAYAAGEATFTTWSGSAFNLLDLYVTSAHRGKGIGRRLLHCMVEHVLGLGGQRLSWAASERNVKAIEFFQAAGGRERFDEGAKLLNFFLDVGAMKAFLTKRRDTDGPMIRAATVDDCEGLHKMIRSLAEAENMGEHVHTDVAMLHRDGFGEKPLFFCFVAVVDNEIIAYALGQPTYSMWAGRICYLEDLYVSPAHRAHGVGTRLLQAFVEKALSTGCSRVQWHAHDWNDKAITFYKSIGACECVDGAGSKWMNFMHDRNEMLAIVENGNRGMKRRAGEEDLHAPAGKARKSA